MKYGDKRDYPKIDIYVGGKYAGSTTWAKSCKEAVTKYLESKALLNQPVNEDIRAYYAD